jgi:hypothetical protein
MRAAHAHHQLQQRRLWPYEAITFRPGGIPLTVGAQCVLLVTISKDYAAVAPTAGIPGFVAVRAADVYPGGDWVYISNGGEASQWTNPLTPWTNAGVDLAFKARFS